MVTVGFSFFLGMHRKGKIGPGLGWGLRLHEDQNLLLRLLLVFFHLLHDVMTDMTQLFTFAWDSFC